jgi:hypothetical protein
MTVGLPYGKQAQIGKIFLCLRATIKMNVLKNRIKKKSKSYMTIRGIFNEFLIKKDSFQL